VIKRGLIDNAAGRARLKRGAGAGTGLAIGAVLVVWVLVSALIHPLPHEASDRAAPLLLGADSPESVRNVLANACGNCHSQNTDWPWYSQVAPFSWLIENDVKRAREHLNLSRWNTLDAVEQRSLLTAIATVVENREMPLHKYLIFHGEARLSPEDSLQVIEWTRAERTRLRTSAASLRQ
jgi:heme-binding protein